MPRDKPPREPLPGSDAHRAPAAGRRSTDAVERSPTPAAAAPADAPATADVPAAGTRFSAAEIHDNVLVAADEEMRRPAMALFWSALAAGLTIGFSFLASAFLTMQFPERLHTAAVAIGYPLGFILVVQARSQLFTENTLEPVIPALHRRDRETVIALFRLWGVVLLGNLIGALAFAVVMARTSALDAPLRDALAGTAAQATSGGFWFVGYRAIFGGWLVALMAWLVSSTHATGAQIVYVWLTTAPIAAFAFRHSIAGSVEAFYRAVTGGASWGAMCGDFIVPAVLGNIVGGVVLVALLNHGQVAAARERWIRPM